MPGLTDPAAFPSWLRGIIRHQAFRILRKRVLPTVAQRNMARLFDRGSSRVGNEREDNNSHLISGEARARKVRNSRALRHARYASEIKDDQHWQFGLRVIPTRTPVACPMTNLGRYV